MSALWTDPRVRSLFSKKVLENMYANDNWSLGFNQDYTGELKGKGSTVEVFSFPDPTVSDYNVPSGALSSVLLSYERLSATKVPLSIDHDAEWSIAEDRTQGALASPKAFEALARNGAKVMRLQRDRELAMTLQNGAGTSDPITGSGVSSAPIVGHGATDDISAYVMLERLMERVKLFAEEEEELHVFMPTWFMTMLRVDVRFSGFGTMESRRNMKGEQILTGAGFMLHETLNSLNGAGTGFSSGPDGSAQNRIIVNAKSAASYVPYINEDEMTDMIPAAMNVLSHDNLLRSRHIWGSGVMRAQGVLTQLVQRGSYEP